MYSGPKSIHENLIFGYDTGYTQDGLNLSMNRFYKGPSGANKIEVLNHSIANTSGTNKFVSNGEEVVDIPKIGKRSVKFAEYFNNYNNSGDLGCCPNLFYYHDGYITGIEPSTSYTYSIIYKHTNNYTHPNFMYRYEYNSSGTYLTEQGVHSTASDRRTHLGNGWYHAWGSFTTQSTTAQLRCYSFLYNYGTTKYKFYVAAVSIVKNVSGSTHMIVPPQLMLSPNTTISSTNSLIDLTRSENIDVSNVSFDSIAQPTFDGTDDYIDLGSDITFKSSGGWTVESVVKYDSVAGGYNNVTSPANFIGADGITYNSWYWSVLSSKLALWNRSPGVWKYGSTTLQADTWYHAVLVSYDSGTSYQMYLNGEAEGGDHTSYSWNSDYAGLKVRYIGRGNSSNTRLVNGEIAVTKIYNRALSAEEVNENYLGYKSRFGI